MQHGLLGRNMTYSYSPVIHTALGGGKSTIGHLLHERTDRPLIDTDIHR